MLSEEHYWNSSFPELQVRGKSELIWFRQIKSSRAALEFLCTRPHNIHVVQESTKPSTSSVLASKGILCSAARPGQVLSSTWRPPHGRQAREGPFAQIHSSQISEDFSFALNLTKQPVTIPCHCPVSWNSYFNGLALDLARGKQCYLRKAKFLLNLHLADTGSTNTNQNLAHSLHPSHVHLWCLSDPNKALTQKHPDLARCSTACWPTSTYSMFFLQPTTD